MSKSLPGRQVGKGTLGTAKTKETKEKGIFLGTHTAKRWDMERKMAWEQGGMPLGFWGWGVTCPDLYFRKTKIGHKKNLEYGKAPPYQAPLQQHIWSLHLWASIGIPSNRGDLTRTRTHWDFHEFPPLQKGLWLFRGCQLVPCNSKCLKPAWFLQGSVESISLWKSQCVLVLVKSPLFEGIPMEAQRWSDQMCCCKGAW